MDGTELAPSDGSGNTTASRAAAAATSEDEVDRLVGKTVSGREGERLLMLLWWVPQAKLGETLPMGWFGPTMGERVLAAGQRRGISWLQGALDVGAPSRVGRPSGLTAN